jgi:hypothetical protein
MTRGIADMTREHGKILERMEKSAEERYKASEKAAEERHRETLQVLAKISELIATIRNK